MNTLATKPDWAAGLEEHYLSGSASFFILHGNVDDLIGTREGVRYRLDAMAGFLGELLFGDYDLVLHFDPGRGLRMISGGDPVREEGMKKLLAGLWKGPARPPLEPGSMLRQLDQVMGAVLAREDHPPSTCLIFDYAELLCSRTEAAPAVLATLLNWARNPALRRNRIIVILLSTGLSLLHPALIGSGYTTEIEVPLPGPEERSEFVGRGFVISGPEARRVVELSAGLTLNNLENLMRLTGHEPLEGEPGEGPVWYGREGPGERAGSGRSEKIPPAHGGGEDQLYRLKKQLIEAQCPGLMEFVKPDLKLDLVAGHKAAKERLSQDAGLILEGLLDTVPMGYLICGPVGVGKTFIAMCYAGTVGIPCVVIRNFRSKYVGETEANLESVLKVLRELGPVAVIIDEADAMVGDREQAGDSGTSQRVFGMLASQMGDTSYRGRIIWFLLTCRPDLLPVDLKRQGRCEEHIPLFYPATPEEQQEMFLAMAAKLKISLDPGMLPEFSSRALLSGADIESLLNRARREAILRGRETLGQKLLSELLTNFNPQRGEAHELQELAAILECSDLRYLPQRIRKEIEEQGGMGSISTRYKNLKYALEVFR